MGRRGARGEKILQLGSCDAQPEAVTLPPRQRAERRRHEPRELYLSQQSGTRHEIHGRARVQDHKHAELGFLLVFADVQAVGSRVEPPVHVPGFVAQVVVAVFGELDRCPFLRAAMAAGEETTHKIADLQRERRQLRQQLEVERR